MTTSGYLCQSNYLPINRCGEGAYNIPGTVQGTLYTLCHPILTVILGSSGYIIHNMRTPVGPHSGSRLAPICACPVTSNSLYIVRLSFR